MVSLGQHEDTKSKAGAACAAASCRCSPRSRPADNGPHVTGAGIVADSLRGLPRDAHGRGGQLLAEPQAALCYTCHGSSATGANTDVEDGIGYLDSGPERREAGALRGGGFSYALIDSASAPASRSALQSRRRRSGAGPPAPTSPRPTRSTVLGPDRLGQRRDQRHGGLRHGHLAALRLLPRPARNGNYRALRAIPKDSGAGGRCDDPRRHHQAYTTDNYWQVEDTGAPGFITNISAWCATCHTRYLSSTSYTDSGDAVFTDRHRSDQTAQGSANCVQCHVSHGSNASVATAELGRRPQPGTASPPGRQPPAADRQPRRLSDVPRRMTA